jgi:hypothetical protein
VEWLDEVKDVLEEPHAGAFERMKEVLEGGMELSPHPAVEKALGEISGLLSQVMKISNKDFRKTEYSEDMNTRSVWYSDHESLSGC